MEAGEVTLPLRFKSFLEEWGLLVAFLSLCIALSIASPYFLTLENVFNVLRQVSVTAILAFGMTFVIFSAQIDLSVGAVVALVGVTAAALIRVYPLWLCLTIVLGEGALIGLVQGLLVSKQKIPAFLLTLATTGILRGIAFIYTEGRPIYIGSDVFRVIGRGFIGPVPVPVIMMAVLWSLSYFVFTQTKFGKYVLVVGENQEVARLSGVSVTKVLTLVFVLHGLLGAVGGVVMASRVGAGSPQVATGEELEVISAVVLGGTNLFGGEGNLLGTLLGAIVIGTLMNGMTLLNISPYVQMVVRGLVILGAVWLNIARYRTARK
jgi:ribose transport system permease protein